MRGEEDAADDDDDDDDGNERAGRERLKKRSSIEKHLFF
jgi:hypothetical protein